MEAVPGAGKAMRNKRKLRCLLSGASSRWRSSTSQGLSSTPVNIPWHGQIHRAPVPAPALSCLPLSPFPLHHKLHHTGSPLLLWHVRLSPTPGPLHVLFPLSEPLSLQISKNKGFFRSFNSQLKSLHLREASRATQSKTAASLPAPPLLQQCYSITFPVLVTIWYYLLYCVSPSKMWTHSGACQSCAQLDS